MGKIKPIPEETKKKVIEEYVMGIPQREIAKRNSIHFSSIWDILNKAGVIRNPRK